MLPPPLPVVAAGGGREMVHMFVLAFSLIPLAFSAICCFFNAYYRTGGGDAPIRHRKEPVITTEESHIANLLLPFLISFIGHDNGRHQTIPVNATGLADRHITERFFVIEDLQSARPPFLTALVRACL